MTYRPRILQQGAWPVYNSDPAGIVKVSQAAARDGIWSALENHYVDTRYKNYATYA